MNREKKFLILAGAALTVIFLIDLMQPKPVNWSQSYSANDDIPYGASGLFRVMPELFPGSEIQTNRVPAYDFLIRFEYGDELRSLLFYLNNSLIFDEFETELLLEFVDDGGTVFLSAEQFSEPLKDSLGFGIDEGVLSGMGLAGISLFNLETDSIHISVNRDYLPGAVDSNSDPVSNRDPVSNHVYNRDPLSYRYPVFLAASTISRYDTLNTRVLGGIDRDRNQTDRIQSVNNQPDQNQADHMQSDRNQADQDQAERNQVDHSQTEPNQTVRKEADRNQEDHQQNDRNQPDKPNYIEVTHGDGRFFIHTAPALLTNYFLVDRQREGYIWEVISMLPDRDVYWDEYKKVMTAEARTPLRYLLSINTLRYGLYLALFTLILFITFSAKRRQAIIPVHERPANATISFVKTVTNLFFSKAAHKELAERRITYLFDYFRRALGLDPKSGESITPQLVAARSGVDEDKIGELFAAIASVREKSFIGANELKSLNEKIETFYKTTQR